MSSAMAQNTIRKKVLSFLKEQSKAQNSKKFKISLNRQNMADYLGVDRSALSAELSKMKANAILRLKALK